MKPCIALLSQSQEAATHYGCLLPWDEAITESFTGVDQLIAMSQAVPAAIVLHAENIAQARLVMEQIRQVDKFRPTPVIAILESIEAAERSTLLASGATDVVSLPCDISEIRIRIQRILQCGEKAREVMRLQSQINKLSQYFSNDVVEKILSRKEENFSYGENLNATIFFLDIRNFTTISENVEPNLVAELLNRLYTDIMDLILTYKGSVNKIIGDALLATFGCPVQGERDAENAVECALAIRDTLQLFNDTRPPYLKDNISIGMGIATGRVFAGTIGSYRKMDYTVIGDTVNIAARLEGLTKRTRFDLIIDRATRDLIGDRLKVKKLQVNRVRGRTQAMEIFLVEGIAKGVTATEESPVFFAHRL